MRWKLKCALLRLEVAYLTLHGSHIARSTAAFLVPQALQVQIADLHFPVDAGPCRDPPTLSNGVAYAYAELLVDHALDEEQLDLVVFTGNQFNRQGASWDAFPSLPLL